MLHIDGFSLLVGLILSEVGAASRKSTYLEDNKLNSAKRKRYDQLHPRGSEPVLRPRGIPGGHT